MKFFNLLKKELSELINKQMIISLAAIMLIFMVIGNIMETTISDAMNENYTVNLCDEDETEFTGELIDMLESSGAKVNLFTERGDADYAETLEKFKVSGLIIIPEGFSETLLGSGEKAELISISRMTSAAAMSNLSSNNDGAVSMIEKCITNILAANAGISSEDLALIDSPFTISGQTVIDDHSASVDIDSVLNKIMMQNMLLPIVVFVLIMMTSQTLISAIANEKIDKTLETLLSAPVSRTSVIGAKMLSAALVALINAVIYMFGFSYFITGATNSAAEEFAGSAVTEVISVESAMAQLGLSLSIGDYILIGIQLFFTIMICLSVSLILGAMVSDTKSTQFVIMPIMMLAMVPYIISMLADINSMPMALRCVIYAIPFTHTFSAMSNLMFGNNAVFFGGLIYQIIFFIICMIFALRLFKSDKIFTISLNFGQKSKFKKNNTSNSD